MMRGCCRGARSLIAAASCAPLLVQRAAQARASALTKGIRTSKAAASDE